MSFSEVWTVLLQKFRTLSLFLVRLSFEFVFANVSAVWFGFYVLLWLLQQLSCELKLPGNCRRVSEPMDVLTELPFLLAFALGQVGTNGPRSGVLVACVQRYRGMSCYSACNRVPGRSLHDL